METENNRTVPANTSKEDDPSRTKILNSNEEPEEELSPKQQVEKMLEATPSFVLGNQKHPDFNSLASVIEIPEKGIRHIFYMIFSMLLSLSNSENVVDQGTAKNMPLFLHHLKNFNTVYQAVVLGLMGKLKRSDLENFRSLFDKIEASLTNSVRSFEEYYAYAFVCSGKSYSPLLEVVKAIFALHENYTALFSAVNKALSDELQESTDTVGLKKTRRSLLRFVARGFINLSRKSKHAGDCVYVLLHWMPRAERRKFANAFTGPISSFRFLRKLKGYI